MWLNSSNSGLYLDRSTPSNAYIGLNFMILDFGMNVVYKSASSIEHGNVFIQIYNYFIHYSCWDHFVNKEVSEANLQEFRERKY